jgi:hypothetical protein
MLAGWQAEEEVRELQKKMQQLENDLDQTQEFRSPTAITLVHRSYTLPRLANKIGSGSLFLN